MLEVLNRNGKIAKDVYENTLSFLEKNSCISLSKDNAQSTTKQQQQQHELDFSERASLSKNKLAKQLFEIITQKQTNLCLSADFTQFDQLLKVNLFDNWIMSFSFFLVFNQVDSLKKRLPI